MQTWGAETTADPIINPTLALTHVLDADFPAGLNPRLPATEDARTGEIMRLWNLSPFDRTLIAPNGTTVPVPSLAMADIQLVDTFGGQRWVAIVC